VCVKELDREEIVKESIEELERRLKRKLGEAMYGGKVSKGKMGLEELKEMIG
jgi:hypothetical protein